jgi:uncharacterized protein (DUF2062 family)
LRPRRYLKYQYYRLIRVKDSPAKVAQGIALGFAMDFAIPLPFVSIFIAFLIAKILHFNSLAAAIAAATLKPFFIGIVALNIYVQNILVSAMPSMQHIILPHPSGVSFFEKMVNGLLTRGVPYLMACWINAAIIFAVTYLIGYYLLKARFEKIKHKKRNK